MKWYACEEATLHEGDAVPPHSGHALTLVGKTLLYAVGGADTSNVYVLDISMSHPFAVGPLAFSYYKTESSRCNF